MRVELVSHLPKGSVSGIGRYVQELHRHLADKVDVTVTHVVDPPLAKRFPILHNFPVGVEGHQPGSIVHYTQIMGCAQMLWQPFRPSVATVHDLGMLVWPDEARMLNRIDQWLLHLAIAGLRRVDGVIAVSESTRKTVIEHLHIPPEQVWTVYESHDPAYFHPVANARQRLERNYGIRTEPEAKYLLYVGSELPRKNLSTLLRALALLPPQFRLIKIGRAGGENFRSTTQRLITELDLHDRVVFFENVPDQDLPLFYNAADFYCCTSFIEGFGLPVLESLACGTPVICSNAGSLPEITGGAAILVPPDDAQALVEAILGLSRNDILRAQLSSLGLERAQMFSWQLAARDTIGVYEALSTDHSRQSQRAKGLAEKRAP